MFYDHIFILASCKEFTHSTLKYLRLTLDYIASIRNA